MHQMVGEMSWDGNIELCYLNAHVSTFVVQRQQRMSKDADDAEEFQAVGRC